jgi:hypothetical protein
MLVGYEKLHGETGWGPRCPGKKLCTISLNGT